MSRESVTLKALIEIANNVTPYLKFTGEASEGGKAIPVLDTQIWYGEKCPSGFWYNRAKHTSGKTPGMERELKGRRIKGRAQRQVCYMFYKKPMASRLGILGRSAR